MLKLYSYQNARYPCVFAAEDFEIELHPIKITKDNIENTNEKENETNSSENKVKSQIKASIAGWDPNLRHQLLDALRTHKPDWDKVATEVGKNKEETIVQFLQQAFHDPFVEMEESLEQDRKRGTTLLSHPQVSSWRASNDMFLRSHEKHLPLFDQYNSPMSIPSPFADELHPVLGQAAALSCAVGSDIVGVATKAAFQYLAQECKQGLGIDVGDNVQTKHGRGVVEAVHLDLGTLTVKFPTNVMTVHATDVLNVFESKQDADAGVLKPWKSLPFNVQASQALAAGILGGATAFARVSRIQQQNNIQQLLQQLVILQSKKVKAKMQQLDELWSALIHEYEDIEDARAQMMRERIEIGRQRLQVNAALASASVAKAVDAPTTQLDDRSVSSGATIVMTNSNHHD
ncbi:hypothetical protein RFI_02921 [Reticulomyxa filosa]|uniref:SMARCC C-terminal domain-containing protein n=1 Tax=Reticulomyxa filosa TaxID=46433 RepID=X6P955_RETFI|nr:hypothetical protein RFI_02921 [Reticulomyxa filosa]|eukprot:ETO34172.1 hypothetical protein RFI_02921 [Reticulomyxa filosa]